MSKQLLIIDKSLLEEVEKEIHRKFGWTNYIQSLFTKISNNSKEITIPIDIEIEEMAEKDAVKRWGEELNENFVRANHEYGYISGWKACLELLNKEK